MEGLTAFLQIGAFVVAIGTLWKGLSEYMKNNGFKRAEILEKLIEKFNSKDKLVAKNILEDFQEAYYETIDPNDTPEKKIEKRSKNCNDLTFVHVFYGNSRIDVPKIEDENAIIEDKIKIAGDDFDVPKFLKVISKKQLVQYFKTYKAIKKP
jgi:hypothetical protein